MGLSSLLAHFGIDAPRIVSAVGRVQVGGGSAGLVITPHTFHGGDDPTDGGSNNSAAWWLREGAMDEERRQMAKWFPSFVELEGTEVDPPAWGGVIDTGRGQFRVIVKHRVDHGLPWVIPMNRNLGRSSGRNLIRPKHRFLSGNLCVAAQEDWDAQRDTAAQVVAWAAHWFACYVEWFVNGNWPTEGISSAAA